MCSTRWCLSSISTTATQRLVQNISLIQRENREFKWILDLGPLREEPSLWSAIFNGLIPLEQVHETPLSSLSRAILISVCIYHEMRLSHQSLPFYFTPKSSLLLSPPPRRLSKSRAVRAPRRARDVPQCCDAQPIRGAVPKVYLLWIEPRRSRSIKNKRRRLTDPLSAPSHTQLVRDFICLKPVSLKRTVPPHPKVSSQKLKPTPFSFYCSHYVNSNYSLCVWEFYELKIFIQSINWVYINV